MTDGPPFFLFDRAELKQGRLILASGKKHKNIPVVLENAEYLAVDENRLYLAGQESGHIFVYDWSGQIRESVAVGEHLTGLALLNGRIFTISYHDNRLFRLEDLCVSKTVNLPATPEKLLLFHDCPLVLCHDGFYSYLALYSPELLLKHAAILERGLWHMTVRGDDLLLCDHEKTLFYNECLTLFKHKKRAVHGKDP